LWTSCCAQPRSGVDGPSLRPTRIFQTTQTGFPSSPLDPCTKKMIAPSLRLRRLKLFILPPQPVGDRWMFSIQSRPVCWAGRLKPTGIGTLPRAFSLRCSRSRRNISASLACSRLEGTELMRSKKGSGSFGLLRPPHLSWMPTVQPVQPGQLGLRP
jgi:hypothetical protein